ncbi:hypothetical protein DFH11DRAFT_1723830 [Phellopilus nigrolimitatus]|nr:hypothetical protein DFH11DRAFT_1723830 [Phellopilus nigrolimitatus]
MSNPNQPESITNENKIDKKTLLLLLDTLQRKLLWRRSRKTTLVVHGDVIGILADKSRRGSTQNINYIERMLPEPTENPYSSLVSYLKKPLNGPEKEADLRALIRECIGDSAAHYNKNINCTSKIPDDWMNPAADVTLPWYLDPEFHMVDPLVDSAVREAKEKGRIVYDSPGLRLIRITTAWTFALLLQRFTEEDKKDIVYLLRQDGSCSQLDAETFAQRFEKWLCTDCKAMDYEHALPGTAAMWRSNLMECVNMAKDPLGGHKI